jgi:AcrR family transcriptional regulator
MTYNGINDQVVKGGGRVTNLYQQIPIEKRDMIFQAVLKEFTQHTYDKASTNQIIRDAGISKGLLFHYFKSKKELYLATYDQCTSVFWKLIEPHFTDLSADYFERLLYISRVKLQMFEKEPLIYAFILTAYEDIQHRFPEEFEERMTEAAQSRASVLFAGVDLSALRTDIDQQKALHYIQLSLEAMAQKMAKAALCQEDKGLNSWQEKMKDIELLVELFRHGIYRKENKG